MEKNKRRDVSKKTGVKKTDVYEKSSDLIDALNEQTNASLVATYKAYFKF